MNSEIKRHIDNARQILVGVVPNPTSQIDQITNALIYKFMDDMDQQAIKTGGNASFFIGDFEKYSWVRLMDSRIDNQERMNLYAEAILKFPKSENIPQLFRDILKSAYLPYRSPDVLGLFLKEINYFDYSHPEDLGDAYEYLLSIMSSQGDAGQFRTPRHIIDFIVDVVNPKKDDKVLDPACGTAGFLISAYNKILKQHDGKNDDGSKNNEKSLTPDQKKKLFNNFEGYDIDPGMVRIAQVNMFLHQFKNPKIYQYDSLSMDEKWNEKFDVILANPPFMSPKGGIRPHNKFSIQSNRSEVLFVDYIMNHLKPGGRAGIIVPEGVIFQSGIAYKQLRKNLIEDGLFAVVSLPSGVFNPYSGVKTSILLFDSEFSKKNDELLFIKIENDGFNLGAQRKEIDKNDMPMAIEIINKWKNGKKIENIKSLYIKKEKIKQNGDYNLTGDHYREVVDYGNIKWPIVELGNVCEVSSGNTAPQEKKLFVNGKYPFYRTSDVGLVHLSDNLVDVRDLLNDEGIKGLKLFKKGTILFPKSGASTFLNHRAIMGRDGYVSGHLATITVDKMKANEKYIYYLLTQIDAKNITPDQNYPSLKTSEIKQIKIPLPPIETQEQFIVEIEQFQKIIDGAKQVIENWKPSIDIDEKWEILKLDDISERITKGTTPTTNGFEYVGDGINFIKIESIDENGYFIKNKFAHIDENCNNSLKRSQLKNGDVLFSIAGALGRVALVDESILPANTNQALAIISPTSKIRSKYLKYILRSNIIQDKLDALKVGVAQNNISLLQISEFEIPTPSLHIQDEIISKIEEEEKNIYNLKNIIEIYQSKISKTIINIFNK